MTPIDDKELAEIEARLKAATPGPWQVNGIGTVVCDCGDWAGYTVVAPNEKSIDGRMEDCEFIGSTHPFRRKATNDGRGSRQACMGLGCRLFGGSRKKNRGNVNTAGSTTFVPIVTH